jgi:NADH:ubiquinone oxidoreductase subunit K
LVFAGICLVAAQLVGLYGLVTRKADMIFALIALVLLLLAVLIGLDWAYHRIH